MPTPKPCQKDLEIFAGMFERLAKFERDMRKIGVSGFDPNLEIVPDDPVPMAVLAWLRAGGHT